MSSQDEAAVRAEVRAPHTPEDRAALKALAKRIFTGPDPTGADIPLHDLDEFYLVASWFRRRPVEKANTSATGTSTRTRTSTRG